MADIQKEEKMNVFQIVSDVYQDNVFMPKKKTTFLDIFGYNIDMFHNSCIIAFFFPISLFSIEDPLLLRTCYLLLFIRYLFKTYAGSTILRKTET